MQILVFCDISQERLFVPVSPSPNEAWSSFDQLNGACGAPPTFQSPWLEKLRVLGFAASVYFLLVPT